MLRKCNDFLICVGMLLIVSCLIFTAAFASKAETKKIIIIKTKNTKIIKEKPIQIQQRQIKNGLRRMEKKMKKRGQRRLERRKHISNASD